MPASIFASIPDLKPPYDLLQPSYWEQHRAWIGLIGAGFLVGIILALVWWRRPKPVPIVPLDKQIQNSLAAWIDKPQDDRLLVAVSQLVRQYVATVFGLPAGEYTTDEIVPILAARSGVCPDCQQAIQAFLRDCDTQKFSARKLPQTSSIVTRAQALLDQIQSHANPPKPQESHRSA